MTIGRGGSGAPTKREADLTQRLTKLDRNGTPYRRPPAIESKIGEFSGKSIEDILRCSRRSTANGDLLPLEVLVHFARAAVRRRDQRATSLLLGPLLMRCRQILQQKISDDAPFDAAQLREEILAKLACLFAEDLAQDAGSELDFYECQFLRAFSFLRISAVRRATREAKRLAPVPQPSEEDGDGDTTDEECLARVHEVYRSEPTHEHEVERRRIANAVESLPDDERAAVVLRYACGLPVASKDPDEETVAKRCSVAGRTIRNRLRAANAKLKDLLKEEK